MLLRSVFNQNLDLFILITYDYQSIFFYLLLLSQGFMWDLAPSLNAMVIFAEHRYYGKTMPFGDDSFKSLQNLGYLTSTQVIGCFGLLGELERTCNV